MNFKDANNTYFISFLQPSGHHPPNCLRSILSLLSTMNISTGGFFKMPRYYRRYRRREGRPENDNSALESLSELEEVNESTSDSLKFDDI